MIYAALFLGLITATGMTVEEDKLSRYVGYLIYRDFINADLYCCNVEKVIEGILEASEHKAPNLNDQELRAQIAQMVAEIDQKKQAQKKWEQEFFLSRLTGQEVIEVIPKKLYYEVLHLGNAYPLTDSVKIHFKLFELNQTEFRLIRSSYEGSSVVVVLETLIPALRKMIPEMKLGEIRRIYLHSDLGFIEGKMGISPNQLLMYEVEIVP